MLVFNPHVTKPLHLYGTIKGTYVTLKQGANWVTAREPNGDKAEVADFIIPPQNEVKHLLMKMSQCVCMLITSVIGLSV